MKHIIYSLIILLHGFVLNGQIVAPGFEEQLIADSLNPVSFTIDHHGRIWLIEKNGRVLIIDELGRINSDPFIHLEVDDFNERGLLGIALHPDFDNDPFVYLYYTVPSANHNRVSRFRANGDVAVPGSEEILLNLDPLSGGIHNAGALIFDDFGYLFIATGDAGNSQNAQDTSNLLGKILRLDPEGNIPPDNPYYDELSNDQRAIWSFGHRNPFNLAYDPELNKLYASDVGAGDFEEINLIEKRGNYGWPIIEGPIHDQIPPTDYVDPLFAYDHDDGCAIVGLNVYQPEHTEFPNLYQGVLFFADYCEGYIKVLNPTNGELIETFAEQVDRPLHIEEDIENGNLYYLGRAGLGGGSPGDNTESGEGSLWQVSYTGSDAPGISRAPIGLTIPIGESALFTVRANGEHPLEIQWYINDTLMANDVDSLFIPNVQLTHDSTAIHCIVSNLHGADTSAAALLRVTANTRPISTITSPDAGARFNAGDTIRFAGYLLDAEDGLIDSTHYTWHIDLYHNLHSHPALGPTNGVGSGQYIIPTNGENDTSIHYQIYLSGTDAGGLVGKSSIKLRPTLSTIYINGLPGAHINIDGRIRELPYAFSSLIHLNRTLTIPPIQQIDNKMIYFKQWENGSVAHSRTVAASDTSLLMAAEFEVITLGNGHGLIGQYYNDLEMDFDELPALVRIDTQINFNWGNLSPDTDFIDNDFFTVRWTGYIEPLAAETYKFLVKSDDGSRLWINDQLVIDDWINHPPTEVFGEYTFDTTSRFPIRLEYFERTGGSEIGLSWSSDHSPKQIIPSSQLYPLENKNIHGTVWVDVNQNNILDQLDLRLYDVNIILLSVNRHKIIATSSTDDLGLFEFNSVAPGDYYIMVLDNPDLQQFSPFFGIDDQGRTPAFHLDLDNHVNMQFIYHLAMSNTEDVSKTATSSKVRIFPNPTQGLVYIQNKTGAHVEALQVLNHLGQVTSARQNINATDFTLDLSTFPNGLYLIQLQMANQYQTKSIWLQK